MSQQSQSISLLEETDKQIREQACSEQLKRLKETRNKNREEVIDFVRHCTWYRVSLFSRWKQRGMYATCMWIVQLLLVLSKLDSVFIYIPEFYLEALVDCFHVLRKSDPPFVPPAIFIKQGLTSFVTFVVTHFNDPRISSADLRDLLLQSISVLVQYREYLAAFENNEAAKQRMPKALLSAFDNRSWVPVTNILLRLCKGSGFGSSKHGESSSSSVIFQRLLREACVNDEELFSAFLNRLFNTLSWSMTEFSVSIREMQEKYQVLEFQQRKCCVIFDLSCNLARVLEFCTYEIPQAFLSGPDTNLRRLTELIVFILNHITTAADSEFFDLLLRRHGQSLEKVNRGMIFAPLVGIIVNLLDASAESELKEQNDVVSIFASMDCPEIMHCGFQYLLEYNWATSFRGEAYLPKLCQLENFLSLLISHTEPQKIEGLQSGEMDADDGMCCICYACEADAQFAPCSHRSCFGCITRHLLNCKRCFFCNATVLEVVRTIEKTVER
ncbi:E3 ubiquitin-protein ligase RKP [Herrania umbratica]|uniref:RING-type E3 ubiquitin transferase n=1 Tax=Herrania umbratica TaxID=108875 RepID=A0A6J0ZKC0_9ROSI|nr:E3 ubiquitin-protein ligase RKP [Herrania umbratica]